MAGMRSKMTRHPGWVCSKEQIHEAVWRESGDGGAAVTNVVSQIRKKIGDRYIKTVIGSGGLRAGRLFM